MKTENLLVFGVGCVLGYYAAKKCWLERPQDAVEQITEGAKEVIEKGKDIVADVAAQTTCEIKWQEQLKTRKFGSQKAMETAKAKFIAECVKNS